MTVAVIMEMMQLWRMLLSIIIMTIRTGMITMILMMVIFQTFGVEVLGLDLSENMVDIAIERAAAEKMPQVSLISALLWQLH